MKKLNILKNEPLTITRPETSLVGSLLDLSSLDYSNNRSILYVNDTSTEGLQSIGEYANPYYLSVETTLPSLEDNTVVFINSETTF